MATREQSATMTAYDTSGGCTFQCATSSRNITSPELLSATSTLRNSSKTTAEHTPSQCSVQDTISSGSSPSIGSLSVTLSESCIENTSAHISGGEYRSSFIDERQSYGFQEKAFASDCSAEARVSAGSSPAKKREARPRLQTTAATVCFLVCGMIVFSVSPKRAANSLILPMLRKLTDPQIETQANLQSKPWPFERGLLCYRQQATAYETMLSQRQQPHCNCIWRLIKKLSRISRRIFPANSLCCLVRRGIMLLQQIPWMPQTTTGAQ